jgi:glucose/arabinose dehydrogenase
MRLKVPNKLQVSTALNVMLVILFLFIGANWLRDNTSTFTSDLDKTQVDVNNLNLEKDKTFSLKQVQISGHTLNIPEGFTVNEYASGIESARFLSFDDSDTLYVGSKDGDKVHALSDQDGDGIAESIAVVDQGLNVPHSVKYYKGDLYLAEETQVSVYKGIKSDGSYDQKQILVDNLPGGNQLTGGGHRTRTIDIGPDEKIYLTIGSSCNVCIEQNEIRASMMRFDLDGSNGEIIARGLRNTVGFDFAEDGTIWSTDMGRDQIGDDIPSEEVNIIEPGKHYGWPYCWGNGFFNPEYPQKAEFCLNQTTFPIFNMQAHSAPLGTKFLNSAANESWPEEMRGGLLIAFHGSWNRTVPTGYKVVLLDVSGKQVKQYNLISGWLDSSAEAWGRPVGLEFDSRGNLYVSDDKRGAIYKISYQSTD